MTLTAITSIDDIITLARNGFTNWSDYGDVQTHSKGDLRIFNYTTIAKGYNSWNFFEKVSRGLIINIQIGEIVARPFDKFFRWGEGGVTTDAPIQVATEKLDGSLGILYREADGYHIATRGSFDNLSPQAKWATDYLQANFDLSELPTELTLLFEVIYPDYSVVIDYGEREDLVLLAARNRFTGDYLPFSAVEGLAEQFGFTLPTIYRFESTDALLESLYTLHPSHEGYVVDFADGQRFKFKGEGFKKLRRAKEDLTYERVLESVATGGAEELLKIIHEDRMDEVRGWVTAIQAQAEALEAEAEQAFADAPKDTRRDFAIWAQKDHKHLLPVLIAMLDGEPYRHRLFRVIANRKQ
ncbi:MAG: RNA ligase [Chloroflexota bacterium]